VSSEEQACLKTWENSWPWFCSCQPSKH